MERAMLILTFSNIVIILVLILMIVIVITFNGDHEIFQAFLIERESFVIFSLSVCLGRSFDDFYSFLWARA